VRTFWNVILIFAFVHFLAAVLLVSWLGFNGRLSPQRLRQVRDIFALTLAEEQGAQEQAAELEEQARDQAAVLARLNTVEQGLRDAVSSTTTNQQTTEARFLAQQRHRDELAGMQAQIALARRLLTKKQTQFKTDRDAWLEQARQQKEQDSSEDFAKTVKLLERIKPKQAMQMFMKMVQDERRSQVVEYLAAMNLRKAASVLKQFKTDDEITVASDLLKALKAGRIKLPGVGAPAAALPSAEPSKEGAL
jgi:hypothetical protein